MNPVDPNYTLTTPTEDLRLWQVLETLLSLAAGNLGARVPPSSADDDMAAVATGVNMLAEEMQALVSDLAEASRNTAHQIVEALPLGVLWLDTDLSIAHANPAARNLFAHGTDLVGKRLSDLIPCPIAAERAARALAQGPATFETTTAGPDRRIINLTSAPVHAANASGASIDGGLTPSRLLVIVEDITEKRRVEQVKTDLISLVSHELRTPLASIHGAVGLLASGALGVLPPKAQRLLDIAVRNSERLGRLINDILDLHRLQTGRLPLQFEALSAVDLLQGAATALGPMAAERGITLRVESQPVEVWADRDRVTQVLTNLIGNALKFSTAGTTIRVGARHQAGPSGAEGQIRFWVADQGRGIPADRQERIFEPFEQVQASDARNHGGTGLGLAISRSIVAQHDGRLWVESQPGVGSTFYFELPPAQARSTSAEATVPPILICDDDGAFLGLMRAVLERDGRRVVTARSGNEAVSLARRERPVVVLLDVLMPGMDGWDTLSALKGDAATRDIPVLFLTNLDAPPTSSDGVTPPAWIVKPAGAAQAGEGTGMLRNFERLLFSALDRVLPKCGVSNEGACHAD